MKSPQFHTAGLIFLLLAVMAGVVGQPGVQAQDMVCYWKLIEENPSTTTASTAPTATASLDGSTITVQWEGLTLTGSWTAPGATLIPGEELLFDVSTAWSLGSGSDLNSVGGVNTYLNFNWSGIKVEARRKSINFQSEPDGSISNSLTWTVPSSANEGSEYTIVALMDAAVAGGSVRYKYEYVCEEITPTPTNTVEEKASLEPTPSPSPTPEPCTWILNEDIPQTSTAPAYEDVTVLVQGLNLLISAEGLSLTHTWTPFPDILLPGDSFDSEIVAEWAADRSITFDDPCNIKTTLVLNTGETLEAGKSGVDLNLEPNGYLFEPFTYQVPSGSPFQELTFLITADTCLGYGTAKYTYTCLNSNVLKLLKFDDLEASNINFQAINGEVQVFYPIGIDKQGNFIYDENKYEFARPDMKLPVGTRIYAVPTDPDIDQKDSFAILQFSDSSTFILKTDTLIQLNSLPKQSSNYKLIYGKIKTNINRMMEGDSLEVRTDRAIIGVEGTIFILEDDFFQTTLKVLEGSVTFSSLLDGSALYVNSGQMISADANGLSPITTFDIQAELATWPEDQNLDGSTFPNPAQGSWFDRFLPDFFKSPPLWAGIAILLVGLAGLGLFAFLVFIRAINKQEAAKPSIKTMRLLLLAGLLSVSCLFSLCGAGGLFLNLGQPQAVGIQTELDSPQGVLAETQIALAVQQTDIARALQGTESAPPIVLPPPTEEWNQESTPTLPPPQEPVDVPGPTAQPSVPDKPLTGAQYLTEHGFMDDFSSDALGWSVMDDGVTVLRYENEAYRFKLQKKRGFDFVYFPVKFHPKEILFDVQGPANAHEGTFGVICHLQDAQNYYYVDFDFQAGQYAIQQVLNGELVPLTLGSEYWEPTTALNQPATTVNRISIGCYLGDIQLNINNQVVDIVFIDQPFTKTGSAAFFLFTYEYLSDQGFEVLIDNVEAYDPVQ